MLREPEKRVRVVVENEFAELLKVCDNPTLKALLEVAYRQGLRWNELVNLRWAAVDLERRILHVVNMAEAGELTKSRKNRSLPMPRRFTRPCPAWRQVRRSVLTAGELCPRAFTPLRGPTGSRSRPIG